MNENLICLFSGRVEERDGSFVVEVPRREIDIGDIEPGDTYRVAMLSSVNKQSKQAASPVSNRSESDTPVEAGDVVDVEIENLGDQGDGIARVGPGYVVIIPETTTGERVSVEITEARENVAFAEVVERFDRVEGLDHQNIQ